MLGGGVKNFRVGIWDGAPSTVHSIFILKSTDYKSTFSFELLVEATFILF